MHDVMLVGRKDIAKMFSVSLSTIIRWQSLFDDYPEPVLNTGKMVRWRTSDIVDWMNLKLERGGFDGQVNRLAH